MSNTDKSALPFFSLLLMSYPVLVHLCVRSGMPVFGFMAIMVLGLFICAPAAIRGRRWAWPALVLWSFTAYTVSFHGHDLFLLFLAPILIPLGLAVFFGRTLLPGKTALITRISSIMRQETLPPAIARYTRRVTVLWTGIFIFMAMESLLLAMLASPETWSLFTNLFNYVLVTVVIVVEYLYHSRVYPNTVHNNLKDFLIHLARIDFRQLLD